MPVTVWRYPQALILYRSISVNIYSSQEEWDKFNKSMCCVFDIGYIHSEVKQPNIELIKMASYFDWTGLKRSEDNCKKISQILTGKKQSTETRKKRSISMKGKNLGKKHSLQQNDNHADKLSLEYLITDPNGITFKIKNMKKFCRENSLNSAHMFQVAKGNKKHYKKWTCVKFAN